MVSAAPPSGVTAIPAPSATVTATPPAPMTCPRTANRTAEPVRKPLADDSAADVLAAGMAASLLALAPENPRLAGPATASLDHTRGSVATAATARFPPGLTAARTSVVCRLTAAATSCAEAAPMVPKSAARNVT